MQQSAHEALEGAVSSIIDHVGRRIVLGTPLGVGKPNALLDAVYRRVKSDRTLSLEIATALSLAPPTGKSELEERFLAPIRARVWGDYPRLAYLEDRDADRLPPNVRVVEFYARSGSLLGHSSAQRDLMSTNYTQAARDIAGRGLNVIAQQLAVRHGAEGGRQLSYGSNPDVTAEIVARLAREGRRPFCVGVTNKRMPFFGHRALVADGVFDVVIDERALDHEPFAVPHEPVSIADHAIGLHASTLIRDDGTLQVGIGALGDAACHALRLRHTDNAAYRALVDALGGGDLAERLGGLGTFEEGLYVASELLSNGLFSLHLAGLVKRKVFDPETGGDAGGTTMQGAFFVGPADFYRRLRDMSESERALVDMAGVADVNRIFQAYDVERNQRRHARFLNVCMKVTLFGAAVSDQLEGAQVVSGVGGQHDFVTMAHQLPDGRSVLLFRASRGDGAALSSNVVFEYPHATIARHLRDVFVTEYGVADLRGKTDEECAVAMIQIADSRCQPALVEAAKKARKLAPGWVVPERYRQNVPSRLVRALGAAMKARRDEGRARPALLPSLPFGSDLRDEEIALAGALKKLAAARTRAPLDLARALAAPASGSDPKVAFALRHMGLEAPRNAKERVYARLVRAAHAL